jgi:hypothetical protein
MDARAIDFIKAGDTAIIVFTHGDNFRPDPQTGHGETGNWKITTDALEFVNKIIIYHRPKGDELNHFLLGDYSGFRNSEEPDRLILSSRICMKYLQRN